MLEAFVSDCILLCIVENVLGLFDVNLILIMDGVSGISLKSLTSVKRRPKSSAKETFLTLSHLDVLVKLLVASDMLLLLALGDSAFVFEEVARGCVFVRSLSCCSCLLPLIKDS